MKLVILSAVGASRSEVLPESKDPKVASTITEAVGILSVLRTAG
ncbi:MAG: hypothetical protein WB952_02160 [Terriglobales bacterium]